MSQEVSVGSNDQINQRIEKPKSSVPPLHPLFVVFVVPYRVIAPERKDKTGDKFSIWGITDLRSSFGILIASGSAFSLLKETGTHRVGQLWGLLDPQLLPIRESVDLSSSNHCESHSIDFTHHKTFLL